jgi:hypothetical protein
MWRHGGSGQCIRSRLHWQQADRQGQKHKLISVHVFIAQRLLLLYIRVLISKSLDSGPFESMPLDLAELCNIKTAGRTLDMHGLYTSMYFHLCVAPTAVV